MFLAAAVLALAAVVELMFSQAGLASLDLGLVVMAGVLTALALWSRRSYWLLRVFSGLGGSHRLRSRGVWLLVVLVLLIAASSSAVADVNSYKKLVLARVSSSGPKSCCWLSVLACRG